MARNMYGATSADFTLTSGGRVVPGATLTIWSARTGGVQIADLLDADSVATTTVTSGADGSVVYYGPNNDKTVHWADSGQGARVAIRPVDITGDPPVLSIGTVTTGTAAASLTGTSEAPVLNLTLPSAGANGVDTAAIQDDAVTGAKIAANAVGASELADNAVDTAAIQAKAVTAAKIADDTITATQIAANAVGASELADNAVDAAAIAAGVITNSHISAAAAIAGSKLALSTPVAASDPATKDYVDSLVGASGPYRSTGFAWYDGDAASPDSYYALDAFGVDSSALSGNTGYTRQTTGVAVDPQVQSRMRRCVLKNDGTAVAYYLDCDNSAKIAGTYSGGVQTGWVRVHEGFTDPVRPIPGQATTGCAALRVNIPDWSASATYTKGQRVVYDGKLWDSLSSANTNITPAAGTTDAVLDGTDGQVMVEIPRFYWRTTSDPTTGRTTFSVACNPAEMLPFPNLAVASTAPTSITVGGRAHAVHPAFAKAGVQRPARYIAAYRATATDTGNNGTGTLKSVCDGSTVYAGTISRTNFRTKARNRNSSLTDPSGAANDVWGLVDYHLWHAVQVLFLTEFRTFYAGSVLGGGNNADSDYQLICGRSNGIGNASGNYVSGALVTPTTSDTDGVAYRGIEDLYGSQWLWIDGWNTQYTVPGVEMYVSNTPAQFADGTASNYALAVVAPHSAGAWVYAKALLPGSLLPAKFGGDTTAYTTDFFISANVTSGWYAAIVGGAADAGATDGVLALGVGVGATYAGANVGAALAR